MLDASKSEATSVKKNGLWDAAQQGITVASNAVISLLIVTVLSVEQYGVYSYALALVAIAMSVMNAGLGGLAVKYLVSDRSANAAIISAVLAARVTLGLLGYAVAALVAVASGGDEIVLASLVALTALFGKAFEGPEAWFLSHLRSRRTAALRGVATFVLLALRLAAIVLVPSLFVFIGLFVLEAFITGIGILTLYLREPDSPRLAKVDFHRSMRMLRQSLPLLISGLANQITLRSDVVIVQAILGTTAVGVYALAARLSELAYFLPVVFMNSVLPLLLRVRSSDAASVEYREVLQRAYGRSFWAGVCVTVIFGAAGTVLIPWVFGPEYKEAVAALHVHLLSAPFVFMAAVYSKWIIAEGLLWVSLVRHGAGAVISIVGAIVLIPQMGIVGASLASVIAYVFASYVAAFFTRQTRSQAVLMSAAVVYPAKFIKAAIRNRKVSKP